MVGKSQRQRVTTVKSVPKGEGVRVQMPWERLDENRKFQAAEHHTGSASTMLTELAKWAEGMKAMR